MIRSAYIHIPFCNNICFYCAFCKMLKNDAFVDKYLNSLEKEISSQIVGEYAMDALREIDEVAYIRFASVYRQFKDVSTFMDELKKLLE